MSLAREQRFNQENQMTESVRFGKVPTLFVPEKVKSWAFAAISVVSLCIGTVPLTAWAQGVSNNCSSLPSNAALKNALTHAVHVEESGLDLNMWATIVARDGTVCAVAFSGNT